MNALVKKEIRLLLPSWAMAMALALSAWLIADGQPSASRLRELFGIVPFLLAAMVVMLALNSFGRELSAGTFSNLLAQPIARTRIWWTKTLLLAAAIFSVWAVWWFSFSHNPNVSMSPGERREIFITTILITLVAYAGGLWTVLLFRQVAAAFWFTLLMPGALAMLVAYVTEKLGSTDSVETSLIVVLVAYSIAGFIWARRLFLRAQDVQWTGGEITLPRWLRLPRRFVPATAIQGRRPRLALLAKEFQLHQSQFVIAGGLALLHVGMIVARNVSDGFKDHSALEFLTFQFWVFWLVMPLLIGCAAVAEERKLGTLEAQLCSPARRGTQFVIKFGVALALSLFFGVVVPRLLEGPRILPDIHFAISEDMPGLRDQATQSVLPLGILQFVEILSPCLPYLPLLLILVTLLAISFYVSTLARNTLQSIAPAIGGIVLTWALLVGALAVGQAPYSPLWRGWLIFIIGMPVLVVTLSGLAYWNFKRVLVGWPVWRRNLIIFLAALVSVMVLTSAIYHRAWELFMQVEPPHGPARLSPTQVAVRHDFANLLVQLPDGQVWTDRLIPLSVSNLWEALAGDQKIVEVFPGGRILEGSNWTSAVVCRLDVVAIKQDGSLWTSEQPDNRLGFWRQRSPDKSKPIKLVQVGNENDWKSVAGNYPPAILLKNDGTLWRLGDRPQNFKTNWPGLLAFKPKQMGTESDWAELISDGDLVRLRKADGRTWIRGSFSGAAKPESEAVHFDEQIVFERASYLDGANWRSLTWASAPRVNLFQVGVREDGSFRMWAARRPPPGSVDVQLGKDSNWLGLAGNFGVIVALKADGSLWRWHFPDDPVAKPDSAHATRLGTHSDWVAVAAHWTGALSLAADGSLWYWQLKPSHSVFQDHSVIQRLIKFPPLLAPSRKPQKVANIFNEAR